MRQNKAEFLWMYFAVATVFILFSSAAANETKEITCNGKVIDAEGQAIDGAKVIVYEMWSDGIAGNMFFNKTGEITTTGDGAFIFKSELKHEKGTLIWSYIVATREDLALGWSRWTMQGDMEQNITLGKPEIIEGIIIDKAGKPVVEADVRVNLTGTTIDSDGIERKEWLPGIPPFDELITQTDNQGRFRMNNLPADTSLDLLIKAQGKATLYTRLPGPPKEPAFRTGQTDIEVVLPDEARIEGKIIDPNTREGVAGLKFAVVYTGSGLFFYRFVCQTDDNGDFSIGGLLNSEYLIRGIALPRKYINCISGQTTNIMIQANKPYYGRVVFEDDSSVIIKPLPWEGAETRMFLYMDERPVPNRIDIDDDGYFKVYISQEEYEKIQSRNSWFEIMIHDKNASYEGHNVVRMEMLYVIDLLSTDKTKAGVAKILKPKQEPASLVGNLLPEIKKLGIGLSLTVVHDKKLLVCFFDYEQRPSRICILQLNKRAQELKAKGVEVVAVQASKVDKSELDEWIKDNNIPFPVGMVEGDEDKTRFTWGMRAFPWLILTDKQHIVRAEGFNLAELDDKLKSE